MGEPVTLWLMLFLLVLGFASMLLLTDSRYSPGKTAAVTGGGLAVLLAAEVLIYEIWGLQTLILLYSPLVHLPSLLLFLWLSRRRNWQVIFQLLSTILFCFLVHQGASVCYLFSGERMWVLAAAYFLLAAAVILFLACYLRPLARRVFSQVRRGWWLMCLLLAWYYAISIYLIPGLAGISVLATLLKAAISLLMAGVYAVFLHLLGSLCRETEAQYSARLSAARLSALKDRIQVTAAAEESVRLARHDLRHRLRAIAELARKGDCGAILALADSAEGQLDAQAPKHWCRDPILDAVFSYYFAEAEAQGVRVEARLRLPDPLPMEQESLAMLFANALENAVQANAALPAGERRLTCRVAAHPKFMFEIANPVASPVRFDGQGLPLSAQEGHGLGTRSIADLCRKHGFLCRFEVTDGRFRLLVVQ